ncbi:hypothetical protein [Streptomyces sp. NPDC057002]|uniref:hypothetical protein n=1 Tax=Streptomyces sp. NPDC057002 TaxID=3345992 RepID=UPI00363F9FD3
MEREQLGEDRVWVWVRAGATAFRMSRIRAGEPQDPFMVAMENIAPPTSPPHLAGEPTAASGSVTAEQMEHIAPPPTEELEGAPVRTSHTPMHHTGWWVVYQLNESVYWGGHVLLLDTDTWRYYGSGYYGTWNQYLYQW